MKRHLQQEAGAGLLLAGVACLSILLANSPWSGLWLTILDEPFLSDPNHHLGTTRGIIGNALMVVFFFVVGLEVKREMLIGNLSDPRQRRLPVLAALAGMAAPALVYTAICWSQPALHRGWAIPAATDIAFALGVMALLGPRVPSGLRLFLLTVAVVDDIGAVVVIALAYTAHIDAIWLAAAAFVLGVMLGLNRWNCLRTWPYMLLAVALWWCVLHSGLHATVAGVVAALTVPLALDEHKDSPLLRLEHSLAPWSGLVIVPLFGLSHAGVQLSGDALSSGTTLPLAIALGLVLGKPLGVFGAIVLAEKTGFARRPQGVSWLQALGAGQLAGIGFTMSMFIGTLAFPPDPLRENAIRLGILGGSLLAGALGAALLWKGAAREGTAP
ncbi:Na+/H+ antiporter NhaA [Novosphingobium umbonatum]|uniref:Na(+)/H(+) antiporter NhaA n=1 Tax=Novosphingobium umbonatum TaxID=1908524 RepID=A0A3S3TP34_9SPHN|nr:Na+/H+ antiporter NhaA [Novosphingobium umbonatum]RVU05364.1 Na+/H+ antiporter NhaA [Novosphingobium umbonatum]